MTQLKRVLIQTTTLFFLAVLLGACGDPPSSSQSGEPSTDGFQNYRETGDLDDLRERGIVRLLAPRSNEYTALPRDGFPLQSYYEVAEQFVEAQGLAVEWIWVDDFAQLLDALESGQGDIAVTNMTRTDAREQRVAFTVPLLVVDEVLIVADENGDKSLDELGALKVTVPEGTSWDETLTGLVGEQSALSRELVPGSTSDWAMLEGVAAGTYQATVLDADVAEALVPLVPGTAIGPLLRADRDIAWAVREGSADLREALNEYLISTRVVASRDTRVKRNWANIKQSGALRVITTNNPASYFLWRGELMGFDYELVNEFAKKHKLRVRVVVRDGPESMYEALEQGYGDVIAGAVTRTPERVQNGWTFSRRYLRVSEQVIGAEGAEEFADLSALNGKTVAVNPEHSYMETLLALQERGIHVDIQPVPGATSEMIMADVADGLYDYTLVDSHLAAMETTFRTDIRIVYDLAEDKDIGWVVRPEQQELLAAMNTFIRKAYRGLHYNIYFNRYFSEPKSIAKYREERVVAGKAISPYDEMVREYASVGDYDWRLLTAQMYQESRFDPKARSYAGALGLMQMMPRTGAQFGFQDVRPPEENIEASIQFMEWLKQRFPDSLPLEERIYFTLAAYNAGHGHVHDARRLAGQLGKDPNRWFGNVEQAMLLLSQPQYSRKAQYGYVRGAEPVAYVRDIRDRYVGYLDANAGSVD
ncbi:MAG: transporter substrate-binding domain-containing protein [Gammaproteobacteria bacterium]|nr:transporter substrate-binding domain-containing protein [Gammaproteobacteria bacterium]MBQ0775498.1 transporter substrate-binding domain-containing protein [Gammaproteobacteria bacterium]